MLVIDGGSTIKNGTRDEGGNRYCILVKYRSFFFVNMVD